MCSLCLSVPACWADREAYTQWNSLCGDAGRNSFPSITGKAVRVD